MEYNIGNKKLQIEYNIEEEISPSQIVLRYIPKFYEKAIFSMESKPTNSDRKSLTSKTKNYIPKKEIKFKKHYLILKCVSL